MRNQSVIGLALCCGAVAAGQDVGFVDFDGTELGLIDYANPAYTYSGSGFGTDAVQVSSDNNGSSDWSPGDAFWPMTRAAIGPNAIGMPFAISDDSVEPAAGNTLFETDTQGFAGIDYNNDGFFGVTDTENGVNSGPITAEFTFDITGASNLSVSVDFTAMGDFEAADSFLFEYSIDGDEFAPLLTATVDEASSQTYMMDNPANNPVVLDDPVLIEGNLLDDNLQTLSAAIDGTGAVLAVRFTAVADGGTEGFGFDNLRVTGDVGGGFTLEIAGDCPGPMTVTTSGGTPDAFVAIIYAFGEGSVEIPPDNPCAGTELGLNATARLLTTVQNDANGVSEFTGNAPAGACGNVFLQALDVASCTTSNVVLIQ